MKWRSLLRPAWATPLTRILKTTEVKPERHTATRPDRQTFRTFNDNADTHMALLAAKAVAKAPAKMYNPLFIYGPAGSGKTHLLKAIQYSHEDPSRTPRRKVVYTTTEAFTNELIHAIRFDKMTGFRNKYRAADTLLFDDLDFFKDKERTRQEFFHTLDTLITDQKQVVITSTVYPNVSDPHLRWRIHHGLVVATARHD